MTPEKNSDDFDDDGVVYRVVADDEDLLKVLVVRGIVFIEEQDVDWEGEIDEFENDAVHVLGECGGQPAAAGRVRLLDDGWAKLERIAVRKRWRGQGFAHGMVQVLLDEARRLGATRAKLHAQVYLEDFYEAYGFVRKGDVFDECGIPHILMLREEL